MIFNDHNAEKIIELYEKCQELEKKIELFKFKLEISRDHLEFLLLQNFSQNRIIETLEKRIAKLEEALL